MPMSGSYSLDGQYMADLVTEQGYTSKDFFIFAASGTNDFAYSAFKAQIMAMADNSGGMFKFANNEADGNMSFLEREGYSHDGKASDEYTYNGLRFFWSGESDSYDVTQGTQEYRDFVLDNVLHSEPSVRAYNAIHKLYEDEGLSDSEIDELLVLDVKPTSYFTDNGISNQHGYGGYLFVRDENIMGWLFGKVKQNN